MRANVAIVACVWYVVGIPYQWLALSLFRRVSLGFWFRIWVRGLSLGFKVRNESLGAYQNNISSSFLGFFWQQVEDLSGPMSSRWSLL